ncbi:riboflavin synthase subunit alpha [Fusobacterium nucleatum subsp. nucleatum ATCC 25586]|uniref:Hypothetical cytosolic protein n=1 Tax=Fusobacterium nucleatum subsp. nucleatum (strain ATCC 25586 / DSM 15643 / BCRC 10681 / CIP 101130 / JCM 8532 / KCTC 2640 / LMG 13131 / VPI 4355) TaxID=190304 RepID=Q8RDP9_FUSNN|nr:Hypothetical cytosolic protein [Fusobacterium nucleatum subsp. nucleatum ATCC 25586]ASG25887.1 riboflavin synthase subunit alpha [Fusobacterium nucleatum subsp. nucleatum]AVQ15745.1 riboflavin synthase subunit alpha [Fusobacterium nucleatum subsp. nucleatum ATCC 25586]AVQ23950.1 riboflavin synthase subunit alpha [Fusobacterium nucleatum subsp. nucleatum ATCC 23726]
MSRVNFGMFEANLLASLPNLQRILNFYSLRNLASNELFLLIFMIVLLYPPKQSPLML